MQDFSFQLVHDLRVMDSNAKVKFRKTFVEKNDTSL